MNNIIYFLCLIAGIGLTVYEQYVVGSSTSNELVRNVILAIVGAGGLMINNFSSMVSIIGGVKLPTFTKAKPTQTTSTTIDSEHEYIRYLMELRDKFKATGNIDAEKKCADLASVIFTKGFSK